jgi:hypothetical protein
MIQFYDDRPADPREAFIYFENVFRNQFLANASPSIDEKREYVSGLLVAKRELKLAVLPEWRLPDGKYCLTQFDEAMFQRFNRDLAFTLVDLKKVCRLLGAAKTPGSS